MDIFTRLNSAGFRISRSNLHVLLQRAYMKAWKMAKPKQTFGTGFGGRMRGDIVDYIPARICFFGTWEPNLTEFMRGKIKPGDVVVDLGANIGYFTLLMAKLVGPSGRVIAIEASPTAASELRANVAQNNCTNVDVREIAVTEKRGEIKLFHSRWRTTNTGGATLVEGRGAQEFDVVKTDTLLGALGAEAARVAFIKIDIEGAELPVLREILANRLSFASSLTVVAEVDNANMHVIADFKSAGFAAGYIENDYSIEAYLHGSIDGLKPFDGSRPETADMVFIS